MPDKFSTWRSSLDADCVGRGPFLKDDASSARGCDVRQGEAGQSRPLPVAVRHEGKWVKRTSMSFISFF